MIFSQFCFWVCIRKGFTAIGSGLPGSCNWHGATAAELAIGTAIWASPERLRTVANGCERLRNVERPQPPDPQSDIREPLLRIQEKNMIIPWICHSPLLNKLPRLLIPLSSRAEQQGPNDRVPAREMNGIRQTKVLHLLQHHFAIPWEEQHIKKKRLGRCVWEGCSMLDVPMVMEYHRSNHIWYGVQGCQKKGEIPIIPSSG